MATQNMRWDGKRVKAKVKRGMSRNIMVAAEMLASDIRQAFPASGQSGTRAGGGDSDNASQPGGIPHVQTAHLKRNIGTEKRGINSARVGTGVGNKDNVGYALWLEKGTETIAPRPYLLPGLKRNKRRILKAMGADVI